MLERHRVVVIGGGFGGLEVVKGLRRAPVEVTLMDRRNFHLFQPLLYQVATGGLSPADIASTLRAILRRQKNTRVLLAEALDLDVARRRVIHSEGEIPYDTLIVATGARHHYFGHPEWEALAPGLKSIEDAVSMRSRILYAFEAAEKEADPGRRRAWLTFVVVGAGPTGVELAGALGEIANDTLRGDFRLARPEESQILLLDHATRVLPLYPPELSAHAERSLIRLGVRARLGVQVTGIDAGGVNLAGPAGVERIEARTVLWAAGVKASPLGEILASRTGAVLDRAGRLRVGPDLSLPGHPEIFVIGDLALAENLDGAPLAGVAPVAVAEGRFVARLLCARLERRPLPLFHYRHLGDLATIGRAAAVADFGRLRFHGLAAWVLWLVIHLMNLVGFQNRLLVLCQWGFHYLTFNRRARLITGETAGEGTVRPTA